MNKTTMSVLFVASVCVATGVAQTPAPAPPATLDIAGSLKVQHQNIRRNLAASADKMPEADYSSGPRAPRRRSEHSAR